MVLRSCHLNPKQVLRVFYATCSAVAHMHSQQPPIVHRDLKVCVCVCVRVRVCSVVGYSHALPAATHRAQGPQGVYVCVCVFACACVHVL